MHLFPTYRPVPCLQNLYSNHVEQVGLDDHQINMVSGLAINSQLLMLTLLRSGMSSYFYLLMILFATQGRMSQGFYEVFIDSVVGKVTTNDSVDVLFVQLTFLNYIFCIDCTDSKSVQKAYIFIVFDL